MELCGFKVDRVWLSPNYQHPLAAKLCVRPPKVLEVQERAWGPLSPCQVWWAWISPATGAAKNVEFFVCLSVCLFICPSRFFIARRSYASAVLGVVILSVCHTRALWLIQKPTGDIFISYERAFLLVFCHPTVVGRRSPLPPKMGDRSDPPPSKIAHVDRLPPVTSQQ